MRHPGGHRKEDLCVSPVIAEVLMVAIVVFLSAIVWLLVSNNFETPEDQEVAVHVTDIRALHYGVVDPDSVPESGDEYEVYDVILNIQSVTPKSKRLKWSDVRLVIRAADGSVLQPSTEMVQDNPGAYDRTHPVQAQYWFIETSSGEMRISSGDSIKLTGMTRGEAGTDDLQGATVILKRAEEQIAIFTLPAIFQ